MNWTQHLNVTHILLNNWLPHQLLLTIWLIITINCICNSYKLNNYLLLFFCNRSINWTYSGYKLNINWVYSDYIGYNSSNCSLLFCYNWAYNGPKLSSIWSNHNKYDVIFSCIWLNPSKDSVIFCRIWSKYSEVSVIFCRIWSKYSEVSVIFCRIWSKYSEVSVIFYRVQSKNSKDSVILYRIWSNPSEDSVIFSCIWLNPSKDSVIFCRIWSKYSEVSVIFYRVQSKNSKDSVIFCRIWSNPSKDSVIFCRIWSKYSVASIVFCRIWSIGYLLSHTPSCGLAWCPVQHGLATVIVSEMCLIVGCALVSLLASGVVSSSSFSPNIECGTESVMQSRVSLCTQWLSIVLVFVFFDMELLLAVLSGMVLTSWVASLIILAVLVFITITLYWELLSDQLIWVL